jgi:seryl-tRNA synthetase
MRNSRRQKTLVKDHSLKEGQSMEDSQSISAQAILDILQREKAEISKSLTLVRARNQELFKEVVRLTEKLKESDIEPDDNIVSIDDAS